MFVSNGDFYATTVVERLGLARDGLVRAGCACYTTADEVDRLVEGVGARRLSAGQDGLTGILHPRLLPLEHERRTLARAFAPDGERLDRPA